MIKLEIFQGEHSLCEKNQKLGEYVIKGLPPSPAGERYPTRTFGIKDRARRAYVGKVHRRP